jgi:hypothetical protein
VGSEPLRPAGEVEVHEVNANVHDPSLVARRPARRPAPG